MSILNFYLLDQTLKCQKLTEKYFRIVHFNYTKGLNSNSESKMNPIYFIIIATMYLKRVRVYAYQMLYATTKEVRNFLQTKDKYDREKDVFFEIISFIF